jgi:hypothetical protein
MRKQEFVTEYERRTDNSKQIFAQLEEAGYVLLGGGQDATVWGRDEGEVLKVIMPSENKEAAEASFMFFFKLCKRLRGNPHVPRFIGGDESFEINGTPYMQFSMEKLKPLEHSSIAEAAVWIMSDFANMAGMKLSTLVKEAPRNNWFVGYRDSNSTQDTGKEFAEAMQDPSTFASYDKLFKTMQYFYKNGKAQGLGWDLHTENVMQRSDGTVVITDPYYTS